MITVKKYLFFACLLSTQIFATNLLWAEETPVADLPSLEEQSSPEEEVIDAPQQTQRIMVLGDEEKLRSFGGSASLIGPEEMKELTGGFDDVNRALATVPGVNIQEEDGYGLRPNIGFRGVPNERSEKITLMEDGTLIAPAPYSAPAAYYFPTFGRMSGMEILKGASQIKYGPQTLAGSLNMLSTPVPDAFRMHARIQGGQDNSTLGHVYGGKSWKYGGFLLEGYDAQTDGFKELDNGDETGYDITDLVGKFRLNTDKNAEHYQQLDFKIQDYDQHSDETYVGLTDEDFNENPYRRYLGSQEDNIDVDHRTYQANHFIQMTDEMDLSTVLYRHETNRDWYKLESVEGVSISDIFRDPIANASQLDIIRGADSLPDSLKVRDNNREYYSQGVQSVLGYVIEADEVSHELEFGARYHEDEEDRFQREDAYEMQASDMILTELGDPGSQDNRIGSAQAWSFFAQDTIGIGKLSLIPGLRYEKINYLREDYGKKDPSRSGVELKKTYSGSDTLIPGLGSTYALTDHNTLFAGVHKGFSPTGPTSTNEVDEEESVNYEVGLRYGKDTRAVEGALFLNDYSNLLGADTLSSGGTGSGDLYNAGEARSWGFEFGAGYDLGIEKNLPVGIPLRASYTYTDAYFQDEFNSPLFGDVRPGDPLPYIAENQLGFGIGLDITPVSVRFDGRYLDAMPVYAGASDVRAGEDYTDDYIVFDLGASVELAEGVRLFSLVKNIFDNEYIVARRPAGARPGLPQTFFAGIEVDL